MDTRYYIAYGSNLNKAQMDRRCPNARIIGVGALEGWQLLFRGEGEAFLTIERVPGGSVPIGLWEVTASDERNLDVYEDFPRSYYKAEVEVTVTDYATGAPRKETAFVYIMHEDRPLGLPSGRYVGVCAEGYVDFDMDLTPLAQALRLTKESMARERAENAVR